MQYLEMQGEPLVALDLAADDNKHEPVATLSAQSIPLVPIAFDTQQKGEIETSNDASHNTLEDQIAKKRNRNREHASKTRLRKKFLLASLQEQIRHLQDQLERFKAETRIQAPQSAHAIIQKVCGNNDAVRHNPLAMPSRLGRMNAVAKSDSRLGALILCKVTKPTHVLTVSLR